MTQTTALADVVLPATSWAEHEAVYTASDRTFQRTTAALPPKGECRHDWQIFADLSTPPGLSHALREHARNMGRGARAVPQFAGATYEKMAGAGYAQWPIFADAADDPENHGTPELYAGGEFTTPDGKAPPGGGATGSAPTEQPDDALPARAVHGARGGALLRAAR